MKLSKYLLLLGMGIVFSSFHPFYLSVTNIKYNAHSKRLEMAVKLFTGDLEDALVKLNGKKIDLINGKNTEEIKKMISSYIKPRLIVKTEGREIEFSILGYEREEEATWIYFESPEISDFAKMTVEDTSTVILAKSEISGLSK